MEAWTIQFEPAGLSFTLHTNSEWIGEYFRREYQHLLVNEPGHTHMSLEKKEAAEEGSSYQCTFPNGSISVTSDLSTVLVWLNRNIKKAFQFTDWWPFHSGAVLDSQGRCVLLCGHSGSGKTTLCVFLEQCGWQCLTDDLIWFHKGSSIRPMPVSFNIRDDVVADNIVSPAAFPFWFPDIDGKRRWIYPNGFSPYNGKEICPSAIFMLTFYNGRKAETRRMSASEALQAVLTNAYSSSNMSLNLEMSAKLVKQVPIFRLWYPNCGCGMDEIEKILDGLMTGGENI